MTTKQRSNQAEGEKSEPEAASPGPADPAKPRECAPATESSTTIVEVTRTVTVVTQLPRIDEYVEDLIDPEFGLESAHETTRAAGKKLLDGFNGTLREMAAAIPPKRQGGRNP